MLKTIAGALRGRPAATARCWTHCGPCTGAAVMSSTMFFAGRAPLPTLPDGVTDGHDIAPALGFICQDVFVDRHLLVRGRFARMLPATPARHYRIGLGIHENTAAVFEQPARSTSSATRARSCSTWTDTCSVYRTRIDVRAIRLAQPLYQAE